MPYAPGVQYTGASMIYDALGSLGDDFAKVMEERRKTEKELAASDTIVENAKAQGLIDDATYNKYVAGSAQQKQGIAFGVISNVHENMKNQLQNAQLQNIQSEIAARQRAESTTNWQPSDEDRQAAAAAGYTYVPTARGQQPVAFPETKPDTIEALNKDVHASTGADLGQWQNAANKRTEGNYVVADIVKPDVFGQEVKSTIRVPKSSYEKFVQRFNTLSGAQGADIGVSAQDQAAKIKAEYQAKRISRDEAKRQLEALGIFQ